MNAIKVIKLHIENETRLLGTRSDGSVFRVGDTKNTKGAKMMLTRRAKQFGLTVKGDFAE